MFIIEIPYFSLDQIYNSGQCFRWIKLRPGKYIIPHLDTAIKIEQKKERLIMNCSEEEFYEKWFEYFDFKTDYSKINDLFRCSRDSFLKECALKSKGIHVLKQDPFEVLITRTILENEKNKEMLNLFAIMYGVKRVQSMAEVGKVTWYVFPKPNDIAIDKLDRMKRYFMDDTVREINHIIKNINNGDIQWNEYTWWETTGNNVISERTSDRLDLNSFGCLEVFPKDKRVNKVLVNEYGTANVWSEDFPVDNSEYIGVLYYYILHDIISGKEGC